MHFKAMTISIGFGAKKSIMEGTSHQSSHKNFSNFILISRSFLASFVKLQNQVVYLVKCPFNGCIKESQIPLSLFMNAQKRADSLSYLNVVRPITMDFLRSMTVIRIQNHHHLLAMGNSCAHCPKRSHRHQAYQIGK